MEARMLKFKKVILFIATFTIIQAMGAEAEEQLDRQTSSLSDELENDLPEISESNQYEFRRYVDRLEPKLGMNESEQQ